MKITEHFLVEEFDCKDGEVYPARWIDSRLVYLCCTLEIIRACIDRPIEILSGYRTKAYNKKIGGARRSQHCAGRAADIVAKGLTAGRLHAVIFDLYRTDRIAIGGLGLYAGFVHVDMRGGGKGKLVRWTGSRTVKQTSGS